MADIKKIVQRIYEFNLAKCELEDGNEMIISNGHNEFVDAFVKRDFDKGIIVTPAGYKKGLVYKVDGFYNNPEWEPDIVTFSLNVYGLKKGAFYRVCVKAKNTKKFNRLIDVTEDRSLQVSDNADELLIKADLSEAMEFTDFVGIFRATSIEDNLNFRLGKIYVSNIIIEEVEILSETKEDETTLQPDVVLDTGKSNICAYGIFAMDDLKKGDGRYKEVTKLSGKGLNLYYDFTTSSYLLERDNVTDIIGEAFINVQYLIEINTNKCPKIKYQITDISPEISPNTLKGGYLKFELLDTAGKAHLYSYPNSRLAVIITKIM